MKAADKLLDAAEYARGDDGEAFATLVLAAGEINREMAEGGDKERIRSLVDRLYKAARQVAKKCGAQGFSISAGFPVGVSVSIDWDLSADSPDADARLDVDSRTGRRVKR